MKKLLTLLTIAISSVALITCSKDDDKSNNDKGGGKNNNSEQEWVCGEYHGKTLYTGPRGGCYYKQSDGEKTYVDRKYCKCLK
jgi:hypothetical protein|nr:MAG TPA: PBCV-specific basic adaptor domain [Caudoviricetes sp.]